MTKNTTSTTSGGIGFSGLLTIVFIVLKLTGYIDWSWWWVWSPSWIPVGIVLGLVVVAGVFWLLGQLIDWLVWKLDR